MTEQPAEPVTEQAFLGNEEVSSVAPAVIGSRPWTSASKLEEIISQQVPTRHHLSMWGGTTASPQTDPPAADFTAQTKQSDLWFGAEEQATRALAEIQDGNINAGIACLQAALAFAQNYRHSLTEETPR